MSPPSVVFLVLLMLGGALEGFPGTQGVISSGEHTQNAFPELFVLDQVLRELEATLEPKDDTNKLLKTIGAAANGRAEDFPESPQGGSESVPKSPSLAHNNTENGDFLKRSRRNLSRLKRVSPTPPPPLPPPPCPSFRPLPAHLSKWEQVKYILQRQVPGCRPHGCHGCQVKRRRHCSFHPDSLMARLALLEDRLRDLDHLENRVKVHAGILAAIQANPNYPGRVGEPGPPGRKGHPGYRGLAGAPGTPGACVATGRADPPAGLPGPPGNKGNPGPPGNKVCGCDGIRGATGHRGVSRQGPQGPRGAKGQKGERGPDAPPFLQN